MKNREKIALALQKELEPLGFRYLKSNGHFKKKVNKDTIVSMVYLPDCYYRGFTDVALLASGEYRDIEEVLYKLTGESVAMRGHFGFVCSLAWILPISVSECHADFGFWDDDSEDEYSRKLNKLIERTKEYLLPYVESLSHKDSALEKAIALDGKSLIHFEYVIPIMYCVWMHDKKAALDYLEEKGQRLLGFVEPGEWERLERMKKGEQFMQNDKPFHAMYYERYVGNSIKIKEWIESQNYGE